MECTTEAVTSWARRLSQGEPIEEQVCQADGVVVGDQIWESTKGEIIDVVHFPEGNWRHRLKILQPVGNGDDNTWRVEGRPLTVPRIYRTIGLDRQLRFILVTALDGEYVDAGARKRAAKRNFNTEQVRRLRRKGQLPGEITFLRRKARIGQAVRAAELADLVALAQGPQSLALLERLVELNDHEQRLAALTAVRINWSEVSPDRLRHQLQGALALVRHWHNDGSL
ncbi:MAG TPA: hypothetical protein VLI05_05370 [Candidatus Saccharimonadia bacterium]|nr:hypothetical protein [Candidatus Saccharimonadia bacterium]